MRGILPLKWQCCCSSNRTHLQHSQERAWGTFCTCLLPALFPNSGFLSKFSIISMFSAPRLVEVWGPEGESIRKQNGRVGQWKAFIPGVHIPWVRLSYTAQYIKVWKNGGKGQMQKTCFSFECRCVCEVVKICFVFFLESSPFLPGPGLCSTSPQHQQSPIHSSGSGWWVAGAPEPNPRPWCSFLCQHIPRAEERDKQGGRERRIWVSMLRNKQRKKRDTLNSNTLRYRLTLPPELLPNKLQP